MKELPTWLQELDDLIRESIPSRRGGIPDVVGWNNEDSLASAIFVECKGPNEGIKDDQEDWLWAAMNHGVRAEQFALSIRPF